MGRRVFILLGCCIALAATDGLAGAHARRQRGPNAAQARAAVRRAERSARLWATVNICNTHRYPNTIGVRGQMPALGFAARLSMRLSVEYWSFDANRFQPVPGAHQLISLGTQSWGTHQAGIRMRFPRHTGYLRGYVRFFWRWHGRQIGQATRPSTPHHPDADYGDPKHFSSWKCVIP